MNFENLGSLLPWWLLGIPLLGGIIELIRTPKSRVGNEHSSMTTMNRQPAGSGMHSGGTRPMTEATAR